MNKNQYDLKYFTLFDFYNKSEDLSKEHKTLFGLYPSSIVDNRVDYKNVFQGVLGQLPLRKIAPG